MLFVDTALSCATFYLNFLTPQCILALTMDGIVSVEKVVKWDLLGEGWLKENKWYLFGVFVFSLSFSLYHIPPTFTAVTCNNVIHQFTVFTSVNICKSHFGGFFLKIFYLTFYFLDFPQFAANLIFGLFQCWQKSVGVFMVDLFVF